MGVECAFALLLSLGTFWIGLAVDNQDLTIRLETGDPAPDIVRAIENTRLVLICDGQDPNMLLGWRKDEDAYFEILNSNLTFLSIRITHGGTYKCHDFNGTAVKAVYVTVLYPVNLPTSTVPTAMKGSVVTIECTANSNPAPSYYWTNTLNGDPLVLERGSTYSAKIEKDQFYVYCWAENTMFPTIGAPVRAVQTWKVVANVLEPAYIWSLESSYTVDVNTDLVIDCLTGGNPPPTIWWTRYDDATFYNEGNRLYIANVQTDVSGYYTCHAENTLNPPGGQQQNASDVKDTFIRINDTAIPAECIDSCRRLVNQGLDSCGCEDQRTCACGTNYGKGVLAAAVVGWSVALILLIAFLFCLIKHRDSNIKGKGADKKENVNMESGVAVSESARQRRNEERLATRPVLPVRPDVARRTEEHPYAYVTGEENYRDREQNSFATVSGKYDYVEPRALESQHEYLQLNQPSSSSNPTGESNQSVGKTDPSQANNMEDYLVPGISNPTAESSQSIGN